MTANLETSAAGDPPSSTYNDVDNDTYTFTYTQADIDVETTGRSESEGWSDEEEQLVPKRLKMIKSGKSEKGRDEEERESVSNSGHEALGSGSLTGSRSGVRAGILTGSHGKEGDGVQYSVQFAETHEYTTVNTSIEEEGSEHSSLNLDATDNNANFSFNNYVCDTTPTTTTTTTTTTTAEGAGDEDFTLAKHKSMGGVLDEVLVDDHVRTSSDAIELSDVIATTTSSPTTTTTTTMTASDTGYNVDNKEDATNSNNKEDDLNNVQDNNNHNNDTNSNSTSLNNNNNHKADSREKEAEKETGVASSAEVDAKGKEEGQEEIQITCKVCYEDVPISQAYPFSTFVFIFILSLLSPLLPLCSPLFVLPSF